MRSLCIRQHFLITDIFGEFSQCFSETLSTAGIRFMPHVIQLHVNFRICCSRRGNNEDYCLLGCDSLFFKPSHLATLPVSTMYSLGWPDDFGAVGWMTTDRENGNTRRTPTSMPLCPSQVPHDLARERTRVAAVRSQRILVWVMPCP
jgi:hypothetical protein